MIKYLSISGNEHKYIDELSHLDLNKDIYIVYQQQDRISFDTNQFTLKTLAPLTGDKSKFIFIPNIRISIPPCIYINYSSAIQGIDISWINNEKITNEYESAIGYKDLRFELLEKDRKLLATTLKVINIIPENFNIVNFNFLYQVSNYGEEVRNVYLIHSAYLYGRFPLL